MNTNSILKPIYKKIKPALILEDELENQIIIKSLLDELRIPCKVFSNGNEAVDSLPDTEYSLFFVDLHLPEMSGDVFIEKLKKTHSDASIIVISGETRPHLIISVMKKGVFDFILKPIDPQIFKNTVNQCLEIQGLRNLERSLSKNSSLRLKAQLDWLNYKSVWWDKSKESIKRNSIYNLQTSLNQGAGFGGLTSMIDLLKMQGQEIDGKICFDKDLVEILYENNDQNRSTLKGLSDICALFEEEVVTEEIKINDYIKLLHLITDEFVPYLESKDLNIVLPNADTIRNQSKQDFSLQINKESIKLLIQELIINAFKYCLKGHNIDIFLFISQGFLCTVIKNDVPPENIIAENDEKIVLEPFYRLVPYVDHKISKLEKFSIGLGLTVVDFLVKKHKGTFFIHSGKDHTGDKEVDCVMAEIFLPLN